MVPEVSACAVLHLHVLICSKLAPEAGKTSCGSAASP